MLPTQLVFKVDKLTEYERDELLEKMQLDKLLKERKDSEVKPSEVSASEHLSNPLNELIRVNEVSDNT